MSDQNFSQKAKKLGLLEHIIKKLEAIIFHLEAVLEKKRSEKRIDATEESGIHKTWIQEAKLCTDIDKFIKEKLNTYNLDYGTVIHLMHAAMHGVISKINNSPQGGITGCQAEFLLDAFVAEMKGYNKKNEPFQIIGLFDTLYPLYTKRMFTLPRTAVERLKQEAARLLEANTNKACNNAEDEKFRKRLQDCANGKLPFPFRIEKNENYKV